MTERPAWPGPSRRVRIDQMIPAELALIEAVRAVENLPPDTRLTRAVCLIAEARELVADFVDGKLHPGFAVPRPSVGRIVLYQPVVDGPASAAMIVKVHSDSCVNLQVFFGDGRLAFIESAVLIGSALPLEAGQWCWPPRV